VLSVKFNDDLSNYDEVFNALAKRREELKGSDKYLSTSEEAELKLLE
jgi:hypothetical protein